MNKLIKAFWFVTLLITMAVLLYTYASFAEAQIVNIQDNVGNISRESFFYLSLVIITLSNFTLYIVARKLKDRENKIAEFVYGWLMSFAVVLNFFFMISMSFVQVNNSGEMYDFTYLGYLIFIALGFIVLWVLALPIFLLKLKNTA
ncbi:MAG TPA: hypothetical protein PKL31_00095 [Fulvivirga sp.]|nr:hypothetical protein [Fulvivirga sp.]